jgi:hypothetical protein
LRLWRDMRLCGLEVVGHGISAAMTVEEHSPQVGVCLPVESLSRRPGPGEGADPAGPPNLLSPGSHDELVSIRNVVARLGAAYPSVDAVTVEATVIGAYDSFHQASVRAYVSILVERRSRRVLSAACRTAPGQAIDGRAAVADAEPEAAVRARGGGLERSVRPAPEAMRSGLWPSWPREMRRAHPGADKD